MDHSEYPENVKFIWNDSSDDTIIIGEGTKFYGNAVVYYGAEIGKQCQFGNNAFIREFTTIGNLSKIGTMADIEDHCKIGNLVTIHSQSFVASKTIIDDFVFIAQQTVLTDTRRISHVRDDPLEINAEHIHMGARIAAKCVILPGLDIGRESMIKTASVVTKTTNPFGIYFGNPAQYVGDISEEEKLSADLISRLQTKSM